MKHTLRLMITALFTVLSVVVFSFPTASAATNNVVYISSDGTGDGSSPDSPLGNAAGYTPGNKMDVKNAFYLGLDKLKNTGGTLVIVGDTAIDSVEARFANKDTQAVAPSEFKTPKFKSGVSVVITSVYNGIDYREKGAELIFDYDTCNTTAFAFGCSAEIRNINILYKYYEGANNTWNTPFMLCGGGYNFIIGNEVNVSSLNTKTNAPGDQYPMIVGGHRYAALKRSYSLTVNSGTWSTIVAGSCGIIANPAYGLVEGNVTLTVSGGKIGQLVGTGHMTQPANTIFGKLTMTVSGGEIDEMYAAHPIEYTGDAINVTILKNAKVGSFFYAPDNYMGDLGTLVAKTTVKNTSPLVINVPDVELPADNDDTPETTLSQTVPDEAETQAPETSYNNTPPAEEEVPAIPTVVWVLLAAAAAVIGVGTYLINRVKLNMLKK